MTNSLTLTDLEGAINYWRHRSPSQGDELRLCQEASALAEPYASMILGHRREVSLDELSAPAQAALKAWRSRE